jgi:AraC family transcriptional activator of pobA
MFIYIQMKSIENIKTEIELFHSKAKSKDFEANVQVLSLKYEQLHQHINSTINLKSSLFILVLNGNAHIEINFKKYTISEEKIILLSFGHFFKIQQISGDFHCLVLYVSKEYIEEMFSTEMIYKRVKYGVKMHKKPLLQLQLEESILLHKRLDFIQENILNDQHGYYKDIILSSLRIFMLDLSHIIEKETNDEGANKQSLDEIYFQQFLEQLVVHYKTEHQVDFYANGLHITPHYLTLIVKRLSGQTVVDLIFQLLYSEAKLVLQQPNLSIQQIATELHFSDQSAFGKFFKRKSGLSPKEFRKRNN